MNIHLKQSFESTFFQMLTIHNTIVDTIENEDKKGRDCFTFFYSTFAKLYNDKKENYKGKKDLLEQTFDHFWKDHQTKLGHYYRFLYNVIRFVAESEYKDGLYIRLIRAQLSDQELLLLFYNATSNCGENFKKYIEDFTLLNNMPTIRLLEKDHIHKLPPKAFNYN